MVQNHNIYKNTMKTLVQNLLTNYKQRDNITTQSKRLREYCASGEKQNLTEVQNVNEKRFWQLYWRCSSLQLQYPAVGTAGAVLQTVNLEAARHLKTAPLLRIQPLQTAKFQPFP